jgi:hypothetical protein
VQTCTPCATEQHVFDGVLPGLDPADAADRQADVRVGRDLLHHVQRDRLDRRAAHPAVRALAGDGGLRRKRLEINAHDRINGID